MAVPPLPSLTGGAAGPSSASQNGATSGMFDSSNWNVNFHGTQTNETTRTGATQAGAAMAAAGPAFAAAGGPGIGIWLIAGVIVLGAVLLARRAS